MAAATQQRVVAGTRYGIKRSAAAKVLRWTYSRGHPRHRWGGITAAARVLRWVYSRGHPRPVIKGQGVLQVARYGRTYPTIAATVTPGGSRAEKQI